MTGGLRDQHALVTGAGQGIGEAIARQLLAQGACVTVLGRRAEPLQKLMADHPQQCQMVLADVADEAQVKAAFSQAVQAQGAINILVNNAGQASSAPFMKMDAAHWQQMLTGIGYLDPAAPKKLMPRLQQLFNRAGLHEE